MKKIACFLLFFLVAVAAKGRGKRNSAYQKNVFGAPLKLCSLKPRTGWYRDGYCHTDFRDFGTHTVCSIMTKEFLEYTKSKGNDLSTPTYYFPGLKPGDKWCLCAFRWDQARKAGKAPKVKLSAVNEKTISYGVKLATLKPYAI